MVGREHERRVIAEAFRAARSGRPSAVLITGEPGAGKTRLLEDAAGGLATAGAMVLTGYALDLGEGAPLFLPLARALAGVWPGLRRAEAPPDDAARVLAAAGMGPPGTPAPDLLALPPAGERLRLLDALVDVCLRLAFDRPLVLALDDMQWAAPEPWDAVAYLVRAAGSAPLLVLLAAREEVLASATGAPAAAIEELRRLRRLTILTLGRLALHDVERLVAAWLGDPAAPELARLVGRRSEGNPFFAEETLADVAERGLLIRSDGAWRLKPEARADLERPAMIRLTVARRLQRLPDPTRRALAAAVRDDDLVVTTSHIKAEFLRRDGVPFSDRLTVVEHFLRHGNTLTHVMIATDPVYLSEPMINTEEFVVMDRSNTNWLYNCETAEEIPRLKHDVPMFQPGQNPHLKEYADEVGLPLDAVRGGAETTYPEYRAKLRQMMGAK